MHYDSSSEVRHGYMANAPSTQLHIPRNRDLIEMLSRRSRTQKGRTVWALQVLDTGCHHTSSSTIPISTMAPNPMLTVVVISSE